MTYDRYSAVWVVTLVLLLTLAWVSDARAEQQCDETKKATTPVEAFLDYGDGTLLDRRTHLVWMRCIFGMHWDGKSCAGQSLTYTRADADMILEEFNVTGYAGRSTWRLPTLKELSSIVESRCHSPSINLQLFPYSPEAGFWTSTPHEGVLRRGWVVHFLYGGEYVSNRRHDWRVRAVSSQ